MVAENGDALELLGLYQVLGGEQGFRAVGRRVAEERLPAFGGELVAGAVGGLDDIGGGIDWRRRQCGAAGVAADSGDYAFVDHLAGANGALGQLYLLLATRDFQPTAPHSPFGVVLLAHFHDPAFLT